MGFEPLIVHLYTSCLLEANLTYTVDTLSSMAAVKHGWVYQNFRGMEAKAISFLEKTDLHVMRARYFGCLTSELVNFGVYHIMSIFIG